MIKEAAAEGSIAITRHEETVAYLISRGRMDAIVETLDLLGNPAAMKARRDDEQGKDQASVDLRALEDALRARSRRMIAKQSFGDNCIPKCNLGTRVHLRALEDAMKARSRRMIAKQSFGDNCIPKCNLGTRVHLRALEDALRARSRRRLRSGASETIAFPSATWERGYRRGS